MRILRPTAMLKTENGENRRKFLERETPPKTAAHDEKRSRAGTLFVGGRLHEQKTRMSSCAVSTRRNIVSG